MGSMFNRRQSESRNYATTYSHFWNFRHLTWRLHTSHEQYVRIIDSVRILWRSICFGTRTTNSVELGTISLTRFPSNSNMMEFHFPLTQNSYDRIANVHDTTAVLSWHVQFLWWYYSQRLSYNKANFRWIWMVVEKPLVTWVPGTQVTNDFPPPYEFEREFVYLSKF